MDVLCPYCGGCAELVDSAVLHGRSYGLIYLCRLCDARVGCHRGTDRPLGTLANAELRLSRRLAHAAFDPLWKLRTHFERRSEAYAWLAGVLGIPRDECHIGMFGVDQCVEVIAACNRLERRSKK